MLLGSAFTRLCTDINQVYPTCRDETTPTSGDTKTKGGGGGRSAIGGGSDGGDNNGGSGSASGSSDKSGGGDSNNNHSTSTSGPFDKLFDPPSSSSSSLRINQYHLHPHPTRESINYIAFDFHGNQHHAVFHQLAR